MYRREALRKWRDKKGLQATYGNLLEIFETAKHKCAEVICALLKNKGNSMVIHFSLCIIHDSNLHSQG